MIEFKSGDVVRVKEGVHTGKFMKVVEAQGAILLLEDSEGKITELYNTQVQKQMLFG